MRNRIVLSILSFCCLASISLSQTAVWQIKPSDYNSMEYLGNSLFIVHKNNKIGIINSQGVIIAPIENDNIGQFYEHKALVTRQDSKGERVMGVLSDNETYYRFSKNYYTLSGQKFYSDGLLSVADENGRVGYIDERGNQVLGFDGNYTKIKPFVEGYAAVFKNKKYYLIDKSGTPVIFRFNGVGGVDGGTNVYNGIVYVWDTYEGKFYIFDVKRGGVCKKVKEPANMNMMDYLYRFSSVSGKDKNVPFTSLKTQYNHGVAPTSDGGLYGYATNGVTILPKQFSSATQFENGNAIVTLNRNIGVLKYIDGEHFKAEVHNNHYNYYDGKYVTCRFSLIVPAIWNSAEKKIVISDNNGKVYTVNKGNDYSFTINPQKSGNKDFTLTVYGEDLKLYETTLTFSFTKKFICSICGKDTDICKNRHTSTTDKQIENHVEKCPTCGKNIKECPVGGDHSKVIY